ncbi:hypothetical protein KAJ02_03630 [Candidatus Bipolaricaulota bacterium]|nr:hypothetical protein [Candidatus Bipolaricaulota bacterium]
MRQLARFVGGLSFPVLATLGTSERIGVSSGVPEGIAKLGLGVVVGAFWGGLIGLPVGAISVSIVSLILGF